MMIKNQQVKISRGYRLKPRTHKLIKLLKEITQSDSDKVISRSCMLLARELTQKGNNKKSFIKS